MIDHIINGILALPAAAQKNVLEPILYTAVCISFPIALLYYLKKADEGE